LRGM